MVKSTFAPLDKPHRPLKMRLLNQIGAPFLRLGIPLISLQEEFLLTTAQRQTGLSDWGDESFRNPLRILLASLEQEAHLHFVGRYLLQQYCLELLKNRLKIQNDLKHHPEIAQVPIKRPIFIVGLPRSGTTFLHNLLAQDPNSRWLRFWELMCPSPPPHPDTPHDPRIQQAEKMVEIYNTLAPPLAAAHSINPTGPEEENPLFEHGFASTLFPFRVHVPSYEAWLFKNDWISQYRDFLKQLQLLSWHYPHQHLILKAPAHLLSLDALLTVFPDACIVQTHRTPVQALPSLCSLSAMVRALYSNRIDLDQIGAYWLNFLKSLVQRMMQVRQTADPARFYDVQYEQLVQNPLQTVRQIYEYFDYRVSTEMEVNVRRWLKENPQHKHGVHRYTLKQFGLEPETVKQCFIDYIQQFQLE